MKRKSSLGRERGKTNKQTKKGLGFNLGLRAAELSQLLILSREDPLMVEITITCFKGRIILHGGRGY